MISTQNLANLTNEEYHDLVSVLIGYKLYCERTAEKLSDSSSALGEFLREQNLESLAKAERLHNRIRSLYFGEE